MTMINLEKGERINLEKEAPGLKKVSIGCGWDVRKDGGQAFDLDASAFLLGTNGKMLNEKCLVYFGSLKSFDESVKHTGDNLTGEGDGDDETINVDFEKVSQDVSEIVVVVNIYKANERSQSFGQVENAFIRLYNQDGGQEICRYDLTEDYSRDTAVVLGKLYKKDGEWRFTAIGQGYKKSLSDFLTEYKN
jgi:tellurium resistance protein TerD